MDRSTELTTFSDLWSNRLPAKFNKKHAVEIISTRIGVNIRNTYEHIKANKLLAIDLRYIYDNTGIAFNLEKGFFLDEAKYDAIQQREEMESAKMFGLSKSYA